MAKKITCIPPDGPLSEEEINLIASITKSENDTMMSLNSFLEESLWARTKNASLEIYVNGLLSNPQTFFANAVGNAFAITTSIFERAIAGAFNRNPTEGVQFQEAMQFAMGAMGSFRDSISIFAKAFNTKDVQVGTNFKGDLYKPHQRAISSEALFGIRQGNPNNNFLVEGVAASINYMSSFVNLPGRLLMSADEAFKTINYRGDVRALAYRKAKKEVATKLGGLPKNAQEREMLRSLHAKYFDKASIPEDIAQQAALTSMKNTFTDPLAEQVVKNELTGRSRTLSGFNKSVQNILNTDPSGIGKTFVPFFQTPINIMKFVGQRTPLVRKFSREIREAMAEGADPAERALAQAKVATGTMLYGVGVTLAWNGLITGAAPSDSNLRKNKQQAGENEYSAVTEDGYVSFNRLDPIGMFLGFSANLATMAKATIDIKGHADMHGYTREIFKVYQEAMSDGAIAMARVISDRHYLQGVNTLIDAMTGDPRRVSKALSTLGKPMNPFGSLYSSMRRGIDKEMNPERQLKTLSPSVIEKDDTLSDVIQKEFIQAMEELQNDMLSWIPGYGGNRSPARNFAGEVTYYPGTDTGDIQNGAVEHMNGLLALGKQFDPTKIIQTTRQRSKWAFINKIAELDINLEGAESIEELSPADGLPGRVTLSDAERDYFGIQWGDLNKKILEPLVKGKSFNTLPEQIQKDLVTDQLIQNRAIARDITVGKYPRIINVGVTDMINKERSKTQNIPGNDLMKRFTNQPNPPPQNKPTLTPQF
jgi:hypothetical protein